MEVDRTGICVQNILEALVCIAKNTAFFSPLTHMHSCEEQSFRWFLFELSRRFPRDTLHHRERDRVGVWKQEQQGHHSDHWPLEKWCFYHGKYKHTGTHNALYYSTWVFTNQMADHTPDFIWFYMFFVWFHQHDQKTLQFGEEDYTILLC